MPKDDTQATTNTTERAQQKPGTFVVLARVAGDAGALWQEIPSRYQAVTGEQAKKHAAQAIFARDDADELKQAISVGGPGLEIQAVSERMWKAATIKVEPQQPKLHIG